MLELKMRVTFLKVGIKRQKITVELIITVIVTVTTIIVTTVIVTLIIIQLIPPPAAAIVDHIRPNVVVVVERGSRTRGGATEECGKRSRHRTTVSDGDHGRGGATEGASHSSGGGTATGAVGCHISSSPARPRCDEESTMRRTARTESIATGADEAARGDSIRTAASRRQYDGHPRTAGWHPVPIHDRHWRGAELRFG